MKCLLKNEVSEVSFLGRLELKIGNESDLFPFCSSSSLELIVMTDTAGDGTTPFALAAVRRAIVASDTPLNIFRSDNSTVSTMRKNALFSTSCENAHQLPASEPHTHAKEILMPLVSDWRETDTWQPTRTAVSYQFVAKVPSFRYDFSFKSTTLFKPFYKSSILKFLLNRRSAQRYFR